MTQPQICPTFLSNISETLLITLYARAKETKRADALIQDPIAVNLIEHLDYDCSVFDKHNTMTTVAVRSSYFDHVTTAFINENPEPVIISLGSGLDTRNHRLICQGNEAYQFIDVDFQDVIALRQKLLPETHNGKSIASSALDQKWMQDLSDSVSGKQILIIAEGLFMYLTHSQIRHLVKDLQANFRGAKLLFDATLPWYTKVKQESVRHTNARFESGISDPYKYAASLPMHLISNENVWQLHPERWGTLGKIAERFPFLRNVHRFLQYQFD